MKKLYLYFLIIILSSTLIYAAGEEQSVLARVTINPVPGVLNVSPNNLSINAPPLSLVEKDLTFSQNLGNVDLDISLFSEISEINSWISFSETNFIVKPNEEKNIITSIDIPDVTTGAYSGIIHAVTNGQDIVIPVNIIVTDKYKINVDIDVSPTKVIAGDTISVFTELTKVKQRRKDPEIDGEISVELVYDVLKGKELITSLSKTMDVADITTETVLIPMPANAARGRYTVEVTATSLDKIATDKDNFSIVTKIMRTFLSLFGWLT